MPKLDKKHAEAVNETEGASGFPLLPPFKTPLVLNGVEAKTGPKGAYWSWEYEIPSGYPNDKRKFWNNTSLSEESRPFMKATFDAFGVPADTDTDELVGCWVAAQIGVRTIQTGDRAGEKVNGITSLMPFKEEDFDPQQGLETEEPF